MPTATIQWKYYKSVHTLKLLLSNMSLFLITTIIYIISKNNNIQSITQNNASEFTNDDSVLPSNGKNSTNTNLDLQPSEINAITESNMSANKKHNTFQINSESILFSTSSIFFIFTLIFGIIYAKHKYKRKNRNA